MIPASACLVRLYSRFPRASRDDPQGYKSPALTGVWGLAIDPTPLTPLHRRDERTTSHKRSFKNSHLHTALIQQHAGPKPPPITLLAQNPHQDVFGQASILISCRQGKRGESWKSFLDEPSSLSSLRPHTSPVEAPTTPAQPNPYGGL